MSMRHPMKHRFAPVALTPIAAALALTLAACGGGGGSAAGAGTSVKLAGKAIDAPISNATITITSGAPLSAGGAAIGTVTQTGADGSFLPISITLPPGSVPIFANAAAPNGAVVLSSYIGPANSLAAAGSLTQYNLPDLDISPVTTAALAVYAQTNSSGYAALTPAAYATTLMTYRSEILAIAAGIKAVGDGFCSFTPPTGTGNTTTDLADYIAQQSNLTSGSSTTLSTVAQTLGSSCATVLAALPGEIAVDPEFGPELDLGDVIDAMPSVVNQGTYQLEAVIAETGATAQTASTPGATISTPNPAAILADPTVSIDASGNITSMDGNVTGTVTGNLAFLTVKAGLQTYNLRLKLGILPTTLLTPSGSAAYVLEGGGTNSTTQVLTDFEAVLASAPSAGSVAAPNWNAFAVGATSSDSQNGMSCATGSFPIRIDASFFGSTVAGGSFGECVAPSATNTPVWTMTPATPARQGEDFGFDGNGTSGMSTANPPAFSAANWTEFTSASTGSLPFILTAGSAAYTPGGAASTSLSGTAYYVMGAHTIVFSSASGNGLLSLRGDSFRLNSLVAETQQGSSDGGSSSVASIHTGDH